MFDFGGNVMIANKLSGIVKIGTIPDDFKPLVSRIYTVMDTLGNTYFLRILENGEINLQSMKTVDQGQGYFTTTIIYM